MRARASAADEQAFGCRDDKLEGCLLQRRAWDANTQYLTPVFTAVCEPLPKQRRMRGEVGVTYEKQRAATIRKRDQLSTVAEEKEALLNFEEAAAGPIGKASRDMFRVGRAAY